MIDECKPIVSVACRRRLEDTFPGELLNASETITSKYQENGTDLSAFHKNHLSKGMNESSAKRRSRCPWQSCDGH
jgi:hypothetical protein